MHSFKVFLHTYQELLAFILGVALVIGSAAVYEVILAENLTYYDDAVHVHADFLVYINSERFDLTADTYQSSIEQILHKNFHLHGNEDHIIHRHAEGLTLAEFLDSLGFTLTDSCIVTDAKETYCSKGTQGLVLYVNDEPHPQVTSYIPQEEDRILLYYGESNNPAITDYLAEITDESCIYSGTCPERGIAPPESCGLTCEL